MNHYNTYLPIDKHDYKSIEILAGLERPKVVPLIPELLEWLQDMNWPIARGVVEVLQKYKVEMIPHIKTLFDTSDDTAWIYNILMNLIQAWDTELISRVSLSLWKLAQTIDIYDDTDLLSIEILCKHLLIEANDATALLTGKKSEIEDSLHSFTPEQQVMFSELEDERLHIINTDVSKIVMYCERNSKSLIQKYQYENSLRRYEEIDATERTILNFN